MTYLLENDDLGNFIRYEDVARSYTGEAQGRLASNVMTDIMRKLDKFAGFDIIGIKFDFSTLAYGKVLYGEDDNANFSTNHVDGKIKITAYNGTPKDYEATVENLASSLIVHEWFGHGILNYGSHRKLSDNTPAPNHEEVYRLVMNNNSLFGQTTLKYKVFVLKQCISYQLKFK